LCALLPKAIARIAVIGPNAHDAQVLLANYSGVPSVSVTPLDGIRQAVSRGTKVWYTDGCKRLGTATDGLDRAGNLSEAKSMAERSDAVVLCLGLSADIEGEQGDAGNSEAAGDKLDLGLTGLQNALLEAVVGIGKPTVVVVLSGSPVDLVWADQHVGAIVQAFYPGQAGGLAIADVIFGDFNPAGRLPVTFPRSIADVPPFEDYAMRGRTYRYLAKEPLYPFGFGLSYTRFRYSALTVSAQAVVAGEGVDVGAIVENIGERSGDEVVQLYVKSLGSSCVAPHHDLRGFDRVTLAPGESQRVAFHLTARDLSLVDDRGRRRVEPGRFRVTVGGSQPDARSVQLLGVAPLAAEIDVVGGPIDIR
jgi:beta-glucosidase